MPRLELCRCISFPLEALHPQSLMFLLGTGALISLMPQQAGDWQIHLLVMDGHAFYANKWSSHLHSAKDDPISFINNNKGETLGGGLFLCIFLKLRKTTKDCSLRIWASWNSFKQCFMLLTFSLSCNWISKGYKIAVSRFSSLVHFVVSYTLLLWFDEWITQLF